MTTRFVDRALSDAYPIDLPAWEALQKHHSESAHAFRLTDLFAADAGRAEAYTLQACDLVLDYSKNLVDDETRRLLADLAVAADVPGAIEAMFAGEKINRTEDRAALHVALRAQPGDRVAEDYPEVADVQGVLARMKNFVEQVHAGDISGSSGKRFSNIVNIGIGGSDLGPVMASRALRPHWRTGMSFHSVSNVDGTQLTDLRKELDPGTTLFVICSKTFTTLETMQNARSAREWIASELGDDAVAKHFVAASTNHDAMDAFGIAAQYRFGFWEWVGGRYSIWSAVGLSIALTIGMDAFESMLTGARQMDGHFREAPVEANMPVLLAMLGIWYNNFFGAQSQAILPYDNRLDRFPAYLQQLQMESSGKRVRADGRPVRCKTGMVIWGEAGNNAQHSFLQLLHQGTRMIPVDFIAPVRSSGASQQDQDLALAQCLAQSEALMEGADGVDAHREYPGNRPSSTILLPELSPAVLGQLVALYEHKVYTEGAVWGINPFDQWGVELGKKLAGKLGAAVGGSDDITGGNASTRSLIRTIRRLRSSSD